MTAPRPRGDRAAPLVAPAASFWRRVLADLVDLALVGGACLGLWVAGLVRPTLPPRRFDWIDYTADLLANHAHVLYPPLVVLCGLGVGYAVLTRALLRGTLGERLLGLRLVDRAGDPAGPFQSIAHAGGTLAGVALLLLGYVWAAVDHNRQTLAEYLSATRLVHGAPEIAPPSRDLTV